MSFKPHNQGLMERFFGIKRTYKKLPDAALYRIYELYKLNCRQAKLPPIRRIEKFKALIPALQNAPLMGFYGGAIYQNKLDIICDAPMVFLASIDSSTGKVDKFLVNWYRMYKPRYDQTEHMWMSSSFDANTNIVNLDYSTDMDRHATPMKKAWKLVLSATVVLLDRFFENLNPQTIELRIRECSGINHGLSYGNKHISSMRLVDAVRAAAKGQVLMN